MVHIRLARPEDAPEVVRVVKAVYDEFGFTWDEADYHADLYDLHAHYLCEGHPFLVAEGDDKKLQGTVAVQLFHTVPGPNGALTQFEGKSRIAGTDCSLERLYVHPDARRKGLGRALMQAAIEAARANRRQAMEIWSDKRFTQAHGLYQTLGASLVGDRICHDPDQSPEWGLILPLV